MQLNNLDDLNIASRKTNFAIFELPKNIDFTKILPNCIHLRRHDDKNKITIDIIRGITDLVNSKQDEDLLIVLENAEIIEIGAANAILKMLEEPHEHVHYIFLCHNSSLLLPTIRSRAFCYYLPNSNHIVDAPEADEKTIALAKSYLSASTNTIYPIAEKISKLSKDHAKDAALEVISVAIDLMYKSYFKTANEAYLTKLQHLLAVEKGIKANGNLKLQLVANML